MILNSNERNILSVAALNADWSIPQIQKITGYKSHTIRYTLGRLRDKSVIQLYPVVNSYSLGYETHSVYFSFSPQGESVKNKVISTFISSDRVSWLAEVSGQHQYCVDIMGKNVKEVRDFLNAVSDKYGGIFSEKYISSQLSFTLFKPDFLHGIESSPSYVQSRAGDEVYTLDQADRRILAGLTSLSYSSFRDLARKLEVSQPTLNRRIKYLKEKRIISGFVYLIDIQSISMSIIKVRISVKGTDKKFRENFFKYCEKHPAVSILIECCGAWDYEAGIVLDDLSASSAIVRDFTMNFKDHIASYSLISKFQQLKVNSYPFLMENDLNKEGSHTPNLKLVEGF